MWFIQTCLSSLGKKYIMALTGFLMGGFLLIHTIGNATIFWGRDAFNAYAAHLHAFDAILPVFELGLLVILLLHVITGFSLFLQNGKAGGKYAVSATAGGRTWASRTMIYTGGFILFFILVHLINFHFPVKDEVVTIADHVTRVLNNPVYTLFYGLAICVFFLHVSHGFWSLLQTFGISHPRYDYALRVVTWALAGIMAAVFLLIVFLLVVNQSQLLPLAA